MTEPLLLRGVLPYGAGQPVDLLLRDGYLSAYPDATLRPRQPLSRARVLHAIARILEGRNLLQLQKANARPASEGQLILRSAKGKDQPLRVNPDAFLMAVAVGASSAFLTPIGHQNNALILGPGGYRFGDYWRMGLPLEVLIVLVAIPMLLIVWPL